MKKWLLLSTLILCGLIVQAQSFSVIDLWPGQPSSDVQRLTPCGNKMIFVASVLGTGHEPWVTDGTQAGSQMLMDVNPGVSSSDPIYLTSLHDSLVLFAANDGVHGIELWVTDGTIAGTQLLADIEPGSGSGAPQNLIVFKDEVWFRAYTTASGWELYKSDGTSQGTVLVKDIYSGSNGSSPNDFVIFQNKLWFSAADAVHGNELWFTDGTVNGTQLAIDVRPGTQSSIPTKMYVLNNTMFFAADNGIVGSELYSTDGTVVGTKLVKDIYPGIASSNIMNVVGFNNKVYFSANTFSTGAELFTSDGTDTGTHIVKDIYRGAISANPYFLYVFKNKLYFTASDSADGYQVWQTDGTDTGTVKFKVVFPGKTATSSYPPKYYREYAGKLYFIGAATANGSALWVSDGTTAGTNVFGIPAGNFNAIAMSANTQGVVPWKGKFWVQAYFTSTEGAELWSYLDSSMLVTTPSILLSNSLTVWPNPASTEVHLKLNSHSNSDVLISVSDMYGRMIEQKRVASAMLENALLWKIERYSKGVYTINATFDGVTQSVRLIKND